MSAWTVIWLAWAAIFVGVEGAALFNKGRGDTLSEHFWRYLRDGDRLPTWLVWTVRGAVLGACAWLGLHLSFGWFTPSHPWPF